ncbi:phospholipase D family protein [Blastococcus capsensis]|uniref:phospholipase D family protein n=1 Tax=Blastococcus capsensis TaxID=1564163 RepID=UPI0025402C45|nr:phospholipase D-like domain-containing protein [Blastococcus capsensis]MDK3257359.1 phospholipase D-like domain-containing protein [Blastococcus capsensis]
MDEAERWLLRADERGNPASGLEACSEGNLAEPLVHGAAYFDRLVDVVDGLGPDDHVYFTDWRGDPDERLRPDGPTVAELFQRALDRGVTVRGLVWRSHMDRMQFSKEQNRALDREVEKAGGQVVLDQRVRWMGSHHQKFVVARHRHDPGRDVAFVGGIDLCHGRRDDADHEGDPQPVPMASLYGDRPAWHDVQVQVKGPAVADIEAVFRERWDDPTNPLAHNPLAWVRGKLHDARLQPDPLPDPLPPPPPCGPHLVQLLQTYPTIRASYEFAPNGERSVARGYRKAVDRARRLVYIEDQYLWSADVARLFSDALTRSPDMHLVVVVPRAPDHEGRFSEVPQHIGHRQAIERCEQAGPGRVHVFDVENPAGMPVYVHAKVCVIDDTWAAVGSDNFNRRSWTHDSELSIAVLDTSHDPREPRDPAGTGDCARTFARDLRLELAREHLDLPRNGSEDDLLLDPDRFVATLEARANALDDWHEQGRRGPRPPGRLRPHRPEKLPWPTRLWATPVYRLLVDPDGRPLRLRRRKAF